MAVHIFTTPDRLQAVAPIARPKHTPREVFAAVETTALAGIGASAIAIPGDLAQPANGVNHRVNAAPRRVRAITATRPPGLKTKATIIQVEEGLQPTSEPNMHLFSLLRDLGAGRLVPVTLTNMTGS